MAIGDTYVLDLGRTPPTDPPCGCGAPSLFVAHLIPVPGIRKGHLPASECYCRKHYWSWKTKKYHAKGVTSRGGPGKG